MQPRNKTIKQIGGHPENLPQNYPRRRLHQYISTLLSAWGPWSGRRWRCFWTQGCYSTKSCIFSISKRGSESWRCGGYEKYTEHGFKTFVHVGNGSTWDCIRNLYHAYMKTLGLRDSWWYMSKSINGIRLISISWFQKVYQLQNCSQTDSVQLG